MASAQSPSRHHDDHLWASHSHHNEFHRSSRHSHCSHCTQVSEGCRSRTHTGSGPSRRTKLPNNKRAKIQVNHQISQSGFFLLRSKISAHVSVFFCACAHKVSLLSVSVCNTWMQEDLLVQQGATEWTAIPVGTSRYQTVSIAGNRARKRWTSGEPAHSPPSLPHRRRRRGAPPACTHPHRHTTVVTFTFTTWRPERNNN